MLKLFWVSAGLIIKSILNSFYRVVDFKGRSSKKELIFYMLFLVILILIPILLDLILMEKIRIQFILILREIFFEEILIIRGIFIYVFLISLIPLICLSFRRLHDINLSGLFIGIPIVVELGLRFVDEVLMLFEYTDSPIGIVGFIPLVGLILLCIPKSYPKDNKYGKYIP